MDAASVLQQRIDELAITVAELETLGQGARVYQQWTSTPIYFLSSRGHVLKEKNSELERLKSGRLNLLYVTTKSYTQYLFCGPRVPSWDFRTTLGRDVFWYVGHADTSRLLFKASSKHWGNIINFSERRRLGDRYPSTVSCVRIAAVPVSVDISQSAGRWAKQLLRISTDAIDSGNTIGAERIANTGIGKQKNGDKVVLYFHGGSYITGNLDVYRNLHARLSSETRLPVYPIEYQLAPQFKYPTQLYDAYCAYMYLRHDLKYNAGDIVISGDSAGGNLALALWQLIHSHNETMAALVLLSPRVDATRSHPFVAPINANLSELPPTLIQASSLESMFSDIDEFATRAIASVQKFRGMVNGSGHVRFQVIPDGMHAFHLVTPDMRGVDVFWHNIGTFVQSLQ
ncbi:hypothetical protein EV175_003930 [Coemansia sp. RSA 1933]|nr:hypothetical protein EV175_003930 [Coemansia sp. RSA 1933]